MAARGLTPRRAARRINSIMRLPASRDPELPRPAPTGGPPRPDDLDRDDLVVRVRPRDRESRGSAAARRTPIRSQPPRPAALAERPSVSGPPLPSGVPPEAAVRGPRCPTCGRAVEWQANRVRPFCSVTCTLVDLGAWLDGRYAIPGEAAATDPGAPPSDPPADLSADPPAASPRAAPDPPPRSA